MLTTRVYVGADHITNHQWNAFSDEWGQHELSKISNLETLTHKDVKNRNWGQQEIFQWLIEADIHFIICHMHQGMKQGGEWNCSEYIQNLNTLDFHLGFPMAEQLRCSIFSQNKIIYIFSLPDRTNDSLAIAMKNIESYDKNSFSIFYGNQDKIFRWKNSQDVVEELSRKGYRKEQQWILKFPFRTNSHDQKFCANFSELTNAIDSN